MPRRALPDPAATGKTRAELSGTLAMSDACAPVRGRLSRPHLGDGGEIGRFATWVLTSAQARLFGGGIFLSPQSAESQEPPGGGQKSCLVGSRPCYWWS